MSEDFDKDGILWKRFGSKIKSRKLGQKKWTCYYVNLIGGSVHYYKDAEDQDPKGTILLKELKLNKEDKEGSSQKWCFTLKNEKNDYLFYCEDEAEWKEWTEALGKAMTKDSCAPLIKEKRKTRAQQLAFKVKKNVGSKVASSSLGMKTIKSQAPEEVKNLIKALAHIVERESKSSKKAAEIEENIFKIGIKSYFLIDGGKFKWDELLEADKPLRQALELLIKCHDHAKFTRNPNPKILQEKFVQVSQYLSDSAEMLTKLFTGHMKPKNIAKVKETTDYLGSPERLTKIFLDDTLNNDLQELIDAAEHYTQFHFYSDKDK